jgi:hypothetical protein
MLVNDMIIFVWRMRGCTLLGHFMIVVNQR